MVFSALALVTEDEAAASAGAEDGVESTSADASRGKILGVTNPAEGAGV